MPPNGDGKCYECENGDWYCPEENGFSGGGCPAGGGFDEFEEIGTAWLPIDEFRDHGFTIWVRVKCEDSGKHSVDVYLERVIREHTRTVEAIQELKWVTWERALPSRRILEK
jgi:hypothetical protein